LIFINPGLSGDHYLQSGAFLFTARPNPNWGDSMQRAYTDPARPFSPEDSKFYLVGGGITSLAAAAFLIRDGDVLPGGIRRPCR
jgi:hypothetical protein